MTKYDLIKEFVDDLHDDELYTLWGEYYDKGDIKFGEIELMDDLDELWKPSDLFRYDLEDFDIYDDYYVFDGVNALVSYSTCRELIDDCYDIDDLIDCINDDYDGYIDGLRDLLDSEEYRKAV